MRKTMMMRAAAAAMTAALVFAQPMSAWAGVVSGGKRATEASEEIAGGPGRRRAGGRGPRRIPEQPDTDCSAGGPGDRRGRDPGGSDSAGG